MGRSTRSRIPAKDGVRDDPASAYDMTHADEGVEQRTLACIVDNEPGVLARVVGLFAARGYNIESLTVAEIDRNAHQSRITIVTSGTNHVLEQIEQQLLRLVPVARVIDTTNESFIFELTGASGKIDQFVELMRPLGLVEVSRTGVLSIQRGKDKAG